MTSTKEKKTTVDRQIVERIDNNMHKKTELMSCCKESLSQVEYKKSKYKLRSLDLEVESISADLHRCAICKKTLGSCPICNQDHGFPIMFFINGGRDGMIVSCMPCVEEHKLLK